MKTKQKFFLSIGNLSMGWQAVQERQKYKRSLLAKLKSICYLVRLTCILVLKIGVEWTTIVEIYIFKLGLVPKQV
jgi:hypothetical protein